jgi:hypothetical protein
MLCQPTCVAQKHVLEFLAQTSSLLTMHGVVRPIIESMIRTFSLATIDVGVFTKHYCKGTGMNVPNS